MGIFVDNVKLSVFNPLTAVVAKSLNQLNNVANALKIRGFACIIIIYKYS